MGGLRQGVYDFEKGRAMMEEQIDQVARYLKIGKDLKYLKAQIESYKSESRKIIQWLDKDPMLIVTNADETSLWYPRGLSTQKAEYPSLDIYRLRDNLVAYQEAWLESGRLRRLLIESGEDEIEDLDAISSM